MDISIIVLTLVFLAMFIVPFLTISISQKIKSYHKTQHKEKKILTTGQHMLEPLNKQV